MYCSWTMPTRSGMGRNDPRCLGGGAGTGISSYSCVLCIAVQCGTMHGFGGASEACMWVAPAV